MIEVLWMVFGGGKLTGMPEYGKITEFVFQPALARINGDGHVNDTQAKNDC